MIREPSSSAQNLVDHVALEQIATEVGDLSVKGQLTRARYNALWVRGLKAVKGHEEYLSTLAMFEP